MKNFNFSLKNLFIYLLFFSLLVITINIVQAIGYDEITFIPINSRLVACEENYQGNASRIDTCTNAAMLYQILNSNLVSQGVTISQTQQLCETLTSATYRNSCFNLMSQQMNSIELCGNISTSGGENNCLSNFLYRQDDISDISSYCSGLGDYISLNDCQDILYSKLAFESDNSEYCLNIIDSEYKNGCFSELGYYCGDGICTYGFESSSSCLADCVGTSFCGNSYLDENEYCDDGNFDNSDGCNSDCEIEEGWDCLGDLGGLSVCNEICSDGYIVGEEVCDQVEPLPCETEDGYTGEYYCNSECSGFTTCNTGEFCGDGVVNSDNEECDDGNENNNDGCSSTCAVEEGWDCLENAQGWSACNEICGDGDIVGEEVCDDGYNNGEYGYCELGCREWAPRCGDDTVTTPPEVCEQNQGFSSCILDSGYAGNQDCNSDCLGFTPCIATEWCGDGDNDVPEQCDDGDTDNGDGCSSICTVETGWICSDDEPSICEEVCGDGDIVGEEVCDDGDIDNGDGCSSQCVIEEGWSCSGEPSECEETCGNGSLDAGEGCDDGNLIDNDGCNSQCVVEENWSCSGQPSTCVCDNGSEYCALVALFIDTNGPVWNSKTNWLSSLPLGQWQGITVNGNNSVIGISLPNNNLNGSIPVEIGDLDYLNTLNLNNNYISDISGLAFLSNLNTLDLSDNNISNIDNLSNLVNLGILNLQNNNISDISGLSGLANLSTLDLRNNILGESSCLAIQLLVDDNLLSFDFDPQDSGFNYFSDCPENCNDGYIWGDEECEPEGLERTGGLSNQSRLTDDPSDHFGRAVAIDGNYMVIGTEDNKAYVFDNLGGEWAIATSISYGSSSDHFGRAVAIDGNYMVIGAENNNHFGSSSNAGAAYIFDNLGGEWAIATSTYYGSIGDHFGSSVAIDGNYMVIGAYGDNNTVGAAYVFDNLGGEWVFQEKLTNPNSSYSWFGISVAIDGNYMVIGAHLDGNSEGAAYVFHLTETGWNQEAKLIAYPREENSYFGKTVAINGDYVVIGAYKNDDGATNDVGAAYIFKKPAGGWNGTTTSTTKFNPNGITLGASDYFGKAVAIDGNYMLIGAYGDDDDGSNAGAAYVFNNLGGEWEFQDQGKLTATFYYGFSGDHFGSSVAIDGNYMLIGADEYNGDTGRVYVFENECFSSVCNSSCRWQCQ